VVRITVTPYWTAPRGSDAAEVARALTCRLASWTIAPQHFCCDMQHKCCMLHPLNSDQAKRFLAKQGCTSEPGKGGHLLVRRGDRTSTLPQHGGRKQLGKGLWNKILKDLGLKE